MFGYKQTYGYFLKQSSPAPVDPVYALSGMVASQELTTNVAALTTQNVSDALSGMVADNDLVTSVVALTTHPAGEELSGMVATLGVATLVE